MIQSIKRLFIVAMAVVLSACATAPGQKFSGLTDPGKDRGDVYLYRASALFASGQSFEVALDGKKVGDLFNASYLHLRLAPGKYTLKVSPGGLAKTSDLQIQVEPGVTSFYQYDFVTGPIANVFFIGSSIQPRKQEQALLDLKELNSAE